MESKITCPKCKKDNEPNTAFCAECRSRIRNIYQIIRENESAIINLPFEQVKTILKNADRLGEKLIEYIPRDNFINKIKTACLKAATIQKTIFVKSKIIQDQKDKVLIRIILGDKVFYYQASDNHGGSTKVIPSDQIESWVNRVTGFYLILGAIIFCFLIPFIIPLYFLVTYLEKQSSVKTAKKYLKPFCSYIQDNS